MMGLNWSYRKREAFADKHGRTCAICGKLGLVSRKIAKGDFSKVYNIDHIVPGSKGGGESEGNLRLLCASCNTTKSNHSDVEFAAIHKAKRRTEYMVREIALICDIDQEELAYIFGNVNVWRRANVVSKLHRRIVSMPEADNSKYA